MSEWEFEAAVQRIRPRLVRYTRSRRSWYKAGDEDIAQTALAYIGVSRAYERIPNVPGDKVLFAYLRKAIRHRSANWSRTEFREFDRNNAYAFLERPPRGKRATVKRDDDDRARAAVQAGAVKGQTGHQYGEEVGKTASSPEVAVTSAVDRAVGGASRTIQLTPTDLARMADIERAMSDFPADICCAVVLYFCEGATWKDTAKEVGGDRTADGLRYVIQSMWLPRLLGRLRGNEAMPGRHGLADRLR